MADNFQLRGQAGLFHRVGSLNPQRQKNMVREDVVKGFEKASHRNSVAPELHGIWALPWPHMDFYLVAYQADSLVPKRFRRVRDQLWQSYQAKEIDSEAYYLQIEELEKDMKAWQKNAPRDTRVRKFWVEGKIYTHLGDTDSSGWNYVTVPQFAFLLQKQYAKDSRHVNSYWQQFDKHIPVERRLRQRRGWPTSIDHLEVFIPRGAKIS